MKSNKVILGLTYLMSATSLVLTTACGSGGGAALAGGSSSGNNTQSTGGTSGTTGTTAGSWQAVTSDVNSTVNGGPYNQYPLIQINAAAQTLELLIPLPLGSLGALIPIVPTKINALQGASFGPATMPDGSAGWELTVPLKYLLQKYNTGLQPIATLPNGSALPYFPAEETDGIAVTIPQISGYSITVYVALKAVAVFVSIPELAKLPIVLGFGYNIVNQAKTANVGYVALVPNSGSYAGGVYLAAQLPTDAALALNSLVSF
jgi:hypothetical protein